MKIAGQEENPYASPLGLEEPEEVEVIPDTNNAPRPAELRNFILLTAYQVVLRTGWIFKTESVIMPAVLDQLSGAAWMRGWLPLLNRFGQSIPPVLSAGAIDAQPKKKWAFAASTALMAGVFAALTSIWYVPGGAKAAWTPYLYLGLYSLFFAAIGVNNLVLNTIQGKLIRTTRRGRLLLVSNIFGSITAIASALLLLPLWLTPASADFASIFGFSTLLFAASSAMAWLLVEEPDHRPHFRHRPWREAFGSAWAVFRKDANFRRLSLVTAIFGASMVLFPHYQAIGHEQLGLDWTNLMWWVVIQNVGTALFSVPAGPIADRHGNRIVIQLLMLGVGGAPLLALVLANLGEVGAAWYHWVFALVGLTPVGIKTLNNYVLEISEPEEHARYLSAQSLCLASPIVLAPLTGLVMDLVGFELVYLAVAMLMLVGFCLSFSLVEPRHQSRTR
jgi:MFS family permease